MKMSEVFREVRSYSCLGPLGKLAARLTFGRSPASLFNLALSRVLCFLCFLRSNTLRKYLSRSPKCPRDSPIDRARGAADRDPHHPGVNPRSIPATTIENGATDRTTGDPSSLAIYATRYGLISSKRMSRRGSGFRRRTFSC